MGMTTGIGAQQPTSSASSESAANAAALTLRHPERRTPAAKPRPKKLGATARSFAILEHVAGSSAPVDVIDIIDTLKLPKATAYRLVDWFVIHGYLAREPGRKRLIVGPRLANLAFGALSCFDALRHAARRAAAPGARSQRDLQHRHPAQRRSGLSRPRGGRRLAAAPALYQRLARAAALQRHRQAVPGAGAGAAPAASAAEPGAAPLHRPHHHRPRAARGRAQADPQGPGRRSTARNIWSVSSAWRCR